MSRIVGIDLGTTNSLVAAVESGIPMVLADTEGKRLTPSVVHFPESGESPIVGEKANRIRILKPSQTAYSVKRFMGRRGHEIAEEEMLMTYQVSGETTKPIEIIMKNRNYLPEEISAEVLKKLKHDAETFFNEPIHRAVITVPAYFNDAQRTATQRAGELAGFAVERIINEPTAAALAYGVDKLEDQAKIAVYDLGGGTFDLSILELRQGVFQVLSTNGNTRLGGDDLDKRIVTFLLDQIKLQGGPELAGDVTALARIREASENAKILLSTESEAEITLPFLTSEFSLHYVLTRERLELITKDIIARTRAHCIQSLADAKLEPADLNQVILVGGQTRMPLVRRFVAEIFQCAEFDEVSGSLRVGSGHQSTRGPSLNTSQNPDEAVALGAAIQAEILSGGFKNMLLLDVTPLSLGLETFGGLMNVIIPRNSTIPIKAGEVFTTAVDYQKSMLIHILQGERDRVADNWSLGRFSIDFEPVAKGLARVGVQFEIDANGILHVLARDLKTGKQTIIDLKSAVDVSDQEVQRMVEESVEHAFDDLRARRWIEHSLQAKQTVDATRKALAEFSGDLEESRRVQIEAALMEIEALLSQPESTCPSANPDQLKKAVAQLDEVTQPLADLMMDRAMESVLRKRGLI